LSAWWRADTSGVGDHVDVSILDCMAVGMVTFPSVFAAFAATCGRRPMGAATRRIEVPSVEPTADGWVNFTTNSAQQFADFGVLIGHPELPEDERYARPTTRFENREEFWEMTRAYTRPRDLSTVLDEARLLRIPVAPVSERFQGLDKEEHQGPEQNPPRSSHHASGRHGEYRTGCCASHGGAARFRPTFVRGEVPIVDAVC
jgi:crotonobetainyl-CoA:carnitine CoA-transferase CaiB-like acyl-CoA transferase